MTRGVGYGPPDLMDWHCVAGLLAERGDQPMALLDGSLRILLFNSAMEHVLGWQRDEVVRREMRQLEGAFYDTSKIQLSRRRIDRTQFFSEVSVETRPVEGSSDQVDALFTVKERPTGALLLGLGFSSVEKVAVSAYGIPNRGSAWAHS